MITITTIIMKLVGEIIMNLKSTPMMKLPRLMKLLMGILLQFPMTVLQQFPMAQANEHIATAYDITAEDTGLDTEADAVHAPLINGEDMLLGIGIDDVTRDDGDNSPSSETEIQASMDEIYCKWPI